MISIKHIYRNTRGIWKYLAALLLFSFIAAPPAAIPAGMDTPKEFIQRDHEDKGIVFKGTITALTDKTIDVNGVQFKIDEDTAVRDQKGNLLLIKALKSAITVKLEVEDGYAETIYIYVRTE